MSNQYKVFISSTALDLKKYRDEVKLALRQLGVDYILMEEFNPSERNALQTCFDEVSKADMFVGIYAYRYGYVPDKSVTFTTNNNVVSGGDSETSITHWEYKWATDRNIPLRLYLIDEQNNEDHNFLVTFLEDEPNKSRLQTFKSQIIRDHVIGFYKSPSDLAAKVVTAVGKYLLEQKNVETYNFEPYLINAGQTTNQLELPEPIRLAFELNLKRIPPDELYTFSEYSENETSQGENSILYSSLLSSIGFAANTVIIGESGIGKTHLLQQVMSDCANLCLENRSSLVPVLVKLGSYSHTQSLFDLIERCLVSKGVNISHTLIMVLIREGRLLLLLDAFDEIVDEYAADVEKEIQELLENNRNCHVIITTRHFRLPQITVIRRYQLRQLSQEQIANFAKSYLNHKSEGFIKELHSKRLNRVASNTLLLTLLISLYSVEQSLPASRGEILSSVVNRVIKRDRSKHERFKTPISWDVRERLLSGLGFMALSHGLSYAISERIINDSIFHSLPELEKLRRIPAGATIETIKENIAATGFVIFTEDGGIFWHRIFMEYYAALEFVTRFNLNPDLLKEYAHKSQWEDILTLTPLSKEFSPQIIEHMASQNIFCAAKILIEYKKFDSPLYYRIVDSLFSRCTSPTVSIRQISLNLLMKFEGEYINNKLHKLVDNPYDDVQMVVLVEIARRNLSYARDIIFSRLQWDVRNQLQGLGSSTTAVIEALSKFDDEDAHLQIIKYWHEKPDMFTDWSCRSALIEVARRGKISEKVKQELLEFFLTDFGTEFEDKMMQHHKYWGLKDVLIELKDINIALRVADTLKTSHSETMTTQMQCFGELLAHCDYPEIIKLIGENVSNNTIAMNSRIAFASALSENNSGVPIELLIGLTQDENNEIKAYGIKGLGKFPFHNIESYILDAIHPPSGNEMQNANNGYYRVQKAAFEVLAEHKQIELIKEPKYQPEYYYEGALDIIYQSVLKYNLTSLFPLIHALAKGKGDTQITIKTAWLLADLGYNNEAQNIIAKVRQTRGDGKAIASLILKGIHRLPNQYALEMIASILENNKDASLKHHCIEALGNIGTDEAHHRLMKIAEDAAKPDDTGQSIFVEEVLRAMEISLPRDKEDWLIGFLNKYSLERFILRRAIELMGLIGSDKSLPLLEHYLQTQPIYIQDTCFWSMQHIYWRSGKVWYNNEEIVTQ